MTPVLLEYTSRVASKGRVEDLCALFRRDERWERVYEGGRYGVVGGDCSLESEGKEEGGREMPGSVFA